MDRIGKALKQVWQRLLPLIVIFPFIIWIQDYLGLSLSELLSVLTLVAIAILIYLVIVAGRHLGSIEGEIGKGFKVMGDKLDKLTHPSKPGNVNPGNPGYSHLERIPTEREPEEKPTGGGAFAGMLIGGALGAAGGPPGIIIGGIIGALIGNQLEYENIQKRKNPPSE
jgi:hypothetical protein